MGLPRKNHTEFDVRWPRYIAPTSTTTTTTQASVAAFEESQERWFDTNALRGGRQRNIHIHKGGRGREEERD
jgi:hypothetical protein